ncbi:hypothetical protein V8C42DRAFT_338281 [Trichoderma barbatum]
MALQNVQVRPQEDINFDEVETFIESLINQPVRSTVSRVPVFSFKTTEENVKLIKNRFGETVTIEAVNA